MLFQDNGPRTFRRNGLWSLVALAIAHWIAARGYFTRALAAFARTGRSPRCSVQLTAVALAFVPTKFKAFIYFQF